MTSEEKQQRGVLAAQVLDNPLYKESMTAMKGEIFDQWASTKWFQYRKRNELWRMYRAAETVEAYLAKTLNRAKLAQN